MGTMNRRLNQAGLSAYNLYKMIWQIFKYALWTSAITLYFPTKITCVPSFKLRRNWCWRRDWKQRKCGAVRCVKLVASAIAAQCWNLYQLSLFFFWLIRIGQFDDWKSSRMFSPICLHVFLLRNDPRFKTALNLRIFAAFWKEIFTRKDWKRDGKT